MYENAVKNYDQLSGGNPISGMKQQVDYEIRIMLNQQAQSVEVLEKTLGNLFTRLSTILSEATPRVDSTQANKQSTLSPMGAELANTNQKLWNIQDGLNELMNRIQL